MTGIGIGRVAFGTGHVEVELRAVNHRFLDLRIRTPHELADLCMHVEMLARRHLTRGRYEVQLRTEGVALPATVLDASRAESMYRSLCEVRDRVAPGSDVPFSMLAQVPEIFVAQEHGERDAMLEAVDAAFARALQDADVMRTREGEALLEDLRTRLAALRKHLAVVAGRRADIVTGHRRRLRDRLQRLMQGADFMVHPARIEQEVAIIADRSDIEEELTRLQSHFDQFEDLCKSTDFVGRRLDFLLQEMSREVNTIGSKSQDAPVAHVVVEAKAEIERMREQVQNVE